MKGVMVTIIVLMLVIAVTATFGWASGNQGKPAIAPELRQDPMSMGKPLSYWLRYIQDLDGQNMDLAFQAIMDLGPDAWPAVPQLTQIVAEPFVPIRVGVDDSRSVVSKIFSIQVRARAIDALAAIGEAAVLSAPALITWALTTRVLPDREGNKAEDETFVDLVVIDVIQRMRVAGAIATFGPGANPAVTALLKSSDSERRKLAVAILSQDAPLIASDLFKSERCGNRKLGISLLISMWPVLAREHVNALRSMLVCDETN